MGQKTESTVNLAGNLAGNQTHREEPGSPGLEETGRIPGASPIQEVTLGF